MLQAMRTKAAGIVVRVLFSILVLSFAIWGIGDYSFLRRGDPTALQIADVKIPASALDQQYRTELDRLRRTFGQIDPETARQFGLMDQVIQRLISQTLLDKAAHGLGLRVGEDVIRSRLLTDPQLQGPDGRFDAARFQQFLFQSNLSEQAFIERVRGDLTRALVIQALDGGARSPALLADRLYRYRSERRSGESVFVAASSFGNVGKPDDAQLQSIYDDNHERFTAPEYRALTVARVSADEVSAQIRVDDSQIEDEYRSRLPELATPERREVDQLLFRDEAAAKAARDRLAAGTAFDQIAKETGQTAEQTHLGLITRADLGKDLADAAFALPSGGVSAPTQSPFGWHVFRVTKIQAGKEPSLAEVKDRLVADIKHRQATDAAYEYATKLEDAVDNGASLEDAAAKAGVPAVKVAAVDPHGLAPDGKPVPVLAGAADGLTAAFDTTQGQVSQLVEGRQGAWFMIRVDGITPSALRPLSNVRDQVVQLWQAEKRQDAAKARAEQILAAVKSGKALDAAASAVNLKAAAIPAVVRGAGAQQRSEVPPEVNARLFALKLNETAAVPGREGFHVIRLTRIEPADPAGDAKAVEQVRAQLGQQIGSDIVGAFVDALRQRYGVTIDKDTIDRLTSG